MDKILEIIVKIRCFLLIVLCFCFSLEAVSQRNQAYESYISRYSTWAVEQMKQYGIPASITLAQGLLESRAGQSRLAVIANNHFGIKVGSGWAGPYVLEDDDERGEKFRKYSSARESYVDHSLFLKRNRRYQSLFLLKYDDYQGWARGLKSCGYATSPTYAQSLIRIIEIYNLHNYDKAHTKSEKNNSVRSDVSDDIYIVSSKKSTDKIQHSVYKNNGLYYIIVEAGDDIKSLSKELGLSKAKLCRYNDVPTTYQLQHGDIIYLQKKKTKGDKKLAGFRHVVQAGESMWAIAQTYGIRLKNLYRLNGKTPDYASQPGDILWLR